MVLALKGEGQGHRVTKCIFHTIMTITPMLMRIWLTTAIRLGFKLYECRLVFNVRKSYCAHYWYRLDVCPSVCPSHAGIMSSNCLHASWYHDSSFLRTKLFPGIPMGTPPTGALNARGRKKVAISDQYLAIARKRLKIDGYMLLCVWLALNPLSIHVTFTAIVPGA